MILTVSDIKFYVEFDYQPEEPRTWEDPGCSAEYTITKITMLEDPTDLSELLSEWVIERLYDKLREGHKEAKNEALERLAEYKYADRMAA